MERKKRLLFVGQSLKVGGIERAMVEQVNALSSETYDVDLLLFYKGGEYLQYVSPKVRIIDTNLVLSCMGMTNKEAKRNIIHFLIRSAMYLLSRIMGNKRLYSLVFRLMRMQEGYDVAISYFHDGSAKGLYYGCNLYVMNKVKAQKKVAWIHSDCAFIRAGSEDNRNMYNCFDTVINVSYAMKQKFDRLGIVKQNHSKVISNRYNNKKICQLAEEFDVPKNKKTVLVTVGRLEKYKSTMELLSVAKQLKEAGHNFTWYFIGTGCLHEEAINYVNGNYISEYVIFTGQIANPYPYIKGADILISGSISETFGLSILEALILNVPVVAYRYDAIDEVVKNGSNGIVADTFEELYLRISELLSDQKKQKKAKEQAKPLFDYNELNQTQIESVL